MPTFTIETPQQFFEGIVAPDVTEFLERELSHRSAYHACNSLLSYRDWVVQKHSGKVWSINRVTQGPLGETGKFQEALNAYDRSFGIVREIANFSKHVTASSPVLHEVHAPGAGPRNEAPSGAMKRVFTIEMGTESHDVRDSVQTAFVEWQKLNRENSW